MTISSEVRKAGPYSGNGVATSFPFAFKVFQANDVVVILADSTGAEKTLVAGADYSVTLNADQDASPGGTVKKTSALAKGHLLTITSRVPNLQPLDLTNQGGFYPRVINAALDRLTILVQQAFELGSRAVKVPISSSTNPDELVAQLHQDALAATAAAAGASASEVAAAASQGAAANSAAAAAGSASTATTQANNAKGSATAAENSATAAASSAAAAKTSESNAAASASAAATSQSAAKTSESNAASSQTAAKASQTAAKTSETNAKSSETNAAGSATAAANSATAAAKSAEDAANSVIGQVVKKTSDTGAAIIPEGTDAQRPLNPSEIPAAGLLIRGSTTSGRPEFFDRSKSGWKPIGTSAELTATESETDSTPGRVIKVGDFGFGQAMVGKQNIAGSEAFGAYYDSTKGESFIFNIPYNKNTAGFRLSNVPYENRFFAQAAVAPDSQNLRPRVEFWHSGNFDANKVFGLAQTWKDITSSRTPGVAYTNASTQPICLQIIGKSASSASQIDLLINGSWVTMAEQGTTTGQTSTTIVMPGQSYKLIATPIRVMELS